MTKLCPRCKETLPITAFNSDKSKANGLESHCRECRKNYKYNNRDKLLQSQKSRNERKKIELAPQRKAWNAIYYAVKTGKIEKPKHCQQCRNEGNIQAHHDDYDKHLDVVWVCQSCHVELDDMRRESEIDGTIRKDSERTIRIKSCTT